MTLNLAQNRGQKYRASEEKKNQIGVVDDFGVISSNLETFKPYHRNGTSKNVNSVKLADFWGRQHFNVLVRQKSLMTAANNLKYEYWVDDRKRKAATNFFSLPHRLENCVIPLEKSKSIEKKTVLFALSERGSIKDVTNSKRLDKINEIIQSCVECGREKVGLKRNSFDRNVKKRLSRAEKDNIENNKRLLDLI